MCNLCCTYAVFTFTVSRMHSRNELGDRRYKFYPLSPTDEYELRPRNIYDRLRAKFAFPRPRKLKTCHFFRDRSTLFDHGVVVAVESRFRIPSYDLSHSDFPPGYLFEKRDYDYAAASYMLYILRRLDPYASSVQVVHVPSFPHIDTVHFWLGRIMSLLGTSFTWYARSKVNDDSAMARVVGSRVHWRVPDALRDVHAEIYEETFSDEDEVVDDDDDDEEMRDYPAADEEEAAAVVDNVERGNNRDDDLDDMLFGRSTTATTAQ